MYSGKVGMERSHSSELKLQSFNAVKAVLSVLLIGWRSKARGRSRRARRAPAGQLDVSSGRGCVKWFKRGKSSSRVSQRFFEFTRINTIYTP